MDDCLFCKIIRKEIPSNIVYEDENVLAFKDINPVAPVHVLIIPREHILDLNEISESNIDKISKCMLSVKEVAKICGVEKSGYRLISNVGEDGGQAVHHLHFHLIGGKKLGMNII